jgi:hypothetical protein
MAVTILNKSWLNKPPVGSQINWGHPISKGLVGCFLMNEGGGFNIKNIYKNDFASLNSTTSWDRKGGLLFNATNSTVTYSPNIFNMESKPCTISALIFPLGEGESNIGKIIHRENASFQGQGFATELTAALKLEIGGGTILVRTSSNNSIIFNKYNFVTVTHKGTVTATDSHIYVNGKETTYQTTTNGVSLGAQSDTLYIGNNRPNGSSTFNGNIVFLYIHNRVLLLREIRSLYTSQYQFITAPKRRFYSIPPVGAALGIMNLKTSWWGDL